MTRHDPHHYHAGRKVSCASGFIAGRPAPLPPLEPIAFKGDRRRSPEFAEACREAAKKAWAKRRAQ